MRPDGGERSGELCRLRYVGCPWCETALSGKSRLFSLSWRCAGGKVAVVLNGVSVKLIAVLFSTSQLDFFIVDIRFNGPEDR